MLFFPCPYYMLGARRVVLGVRYVQPELKHKGLPAPPTPPTPSSLQTRVVGVLCRVGCSLSVDAQLRLRVAGALINVVARPWGALEVITLTHPLGTMVGNFDAATRLREA